MLLQTKGWTFNVDTDNTSLVIFGAIALLILLVIVGSVIGSRSKARGRTGGHSSTNYRRAARQMRMPKPHFKLLEQLIKDFHVTSPNALMSSESQLDMLLKKAIAATDSSTLPQTKKEQRKHLIYEIKQIVDASGQHQKVLPSSQSIRLNTEVSLRASSGATLRSYVVTNLKNGLCVALPSPDDSKRIPKDSQITVTFLQGGTDVFSFTTRLLGIKKMKDLPCMVLAHSQNLRQTQKRKSRRRELDRPAYFYKVNVVQSGEGNNVVKQAVVNPAQRSMGSLMDISAGGCAISAQSALAPGSLVKIEFETGRKMQVTVFGKVRHVSNAPKRGRIMHVMFTTVSRQNLNRIRDFVYGFSRAE